MTSERTPITKKVKRVASDTREWKSGLIRFSVISIPDHPEKNYIKFEKDVLGSKDGIQRFNLRLRDWQNLKKLIESELPEKHQWILDETGLKIIDDKRLVEQIERLAESSPEIIERVLSLPNIGNFSETSFEAIDRIALKVYEVQADNIEKILSKLAKAKPEELDQFASMLDSLHIGQISALVNLVHQKLKIINLFETLATSKSTREKEIHKLIENNPWIADKRYEVSSSDRPLKKYLDENAPVDPELRKRPDLIVRRLPHSKDITVIELKAPSVKLSPDDIAQVLKYQALIKRYKPDIDNIDCFLFGYQTHPSYTPLKSNDVTIRTYSELIDELRDEYSEYLSVLEETRSDPEKEALVLNVDEEIPF